MKNITESKEIEFLGNYYRCTKHAGSKLIEIEKKVPNGFWGKSQYVWERIYVGRAEPIIEIARYCETFPVPELNPHSPA